MKTHETQHLGETNIMTICKWIGAAAIAAILVGETVTGVRADEKNVIEFNYGIPTGAYAQLYVA